MLTTSYSLLERACRAESAAWERLCALYGPVVYGWCPRAGLQDGDAADAVQEVFQAVFQHLADFRRRGGVFHAWLGAISVNQVRLHYHRRKHAAAASLGNAIADVPDQDASSIPDGEFVAAALRAQVVHRALELVRGDFSESTWQSFARTNRSRPVSGRSRTR